MNSWEIIKANIVKGYRPGTMGRNIAMSQCAELYIALRHLLCDEEKSTSALNADEEVREALMNSRVIQELRDAGVIR